MGNSPTLSSHPPLKHLQQQSVLLVRTDENSDHHVSKYQRWHDNELLKCLEFMRWKLNIALLFRPFSCLSTFNCCGEWHQFLYRLTISESLFWAISITLSIFPITWFINTLYDIPPIFEWNPNNVIRKDDDGNFINGPGNIYGGPTSICFVITWVLALRNTLWHLIFGLSFERAVTVHRYCGRLSLIMAFIHFWEYRKYTLFKGQCLTGSIAFGCSILLTVTSIGFFRRKIWTIFLKLHWLFSMAFLVAGLLHGAKYLWIAVSLFAVDILYRVYLIWGKPVKVKDVKLLPCNVIRIEFDKKKFQFDAGQYIFICIPAIDFTQWHPFSISSPPHQEGSIMIHIRVLGDWTKKLYRFVDQRYQQTQLQKRSGLGNNKVNWKNLTIFVEGPYGELQVPLHEYQSIIMISGGIGITPLQSIFNELVHSISRNSSPRYQEKREEFHDFIQRINFVWSVRDPYMVTEFGKRHWAGIQHRHQPKFSNIDDNKQYKYSNRSYDDDLDEYKHYDFESRLPDFYSPDLLLVQQGTKMVQKTKIVTQFYLTRVIDEQRKQKYSQKYKLLKFGRPNIEKIIKNAKNEYKEWESKMDIAEINSDYGTEGGCCVSHERGRGICILCCGPTSMIKSVKKYAAKYNIDCHFEIFEF